MKKPTTHNTEEAASETSTSLLAYTPNALAFPKDATPIQRINMLHRAAKDLAGASAKFAIATGVELIRMKRSLPHGEFGAWVKNECLFSSRTATNYMTLADRILLITGEDGSKQTDMKLLAEGADYFAAIDTALDTTLMDGRTLADLYEDYGIIAPSKKLGGLRENAGRKKSLSDPEAAAALWEETNQTLRSELQNKTFAYLPLKSAQEAFDLMTDLRDGLRRHIAAIKGGNHA